MGPKGLHTPKDRLMKILILHADFTVNFTVIESLWFQWYNLFIKTLTSSFEDKKYLFRIVIRHFNRAVYTKNLSVACVNNRTVNQFCDTSSFDMCHKSISVAGDGCPQS